jgi:hypothetical protein
MAHTNLAPNNLSFKEELLLALFEGRWFFLACLFFMLPPMFQFFEVVVGVLVSGVPETYFDRVLSLWADTSLFVVKQTAAVSLLFGLFIWVKDGRQKVAGVMGDILFAGVVSLFFLYVLKVFCVGLGIQAIQAGM